MTLAALVLATGSAVAVMFSIAVSHILLGAALLVLLLSREKLRIPPVRLPLAAFVALTVAALLLSPDPRAGLPQLKKFYVWMELVVLYTALPAAADFRRIALWWGALATASGAWAFVQFARTRSDAMAKGWDFYEQYVANRATGFMSHWMTFSAEQMMAGLLLASLLLFGAFRSRRAVALACIAIAVIGASIVIAWTRSVWLASAIASVYLIAAWRPRALLLVPVAMAAVWFVAPRSVQERAISVVRPHGQTDSNDHRRVTFRTGVEMIRKHPWFGLGPEIVGREFDRYVPSDIERPLPDGFYGHLHNIYLQYAAERGIPALMALLWLIAKVLLDFSRAVRSLAPEERVRRALLHGAIAGILAILAEGFFEHNLGDSEILTMFLAVVAGGYVAAMPARIEDAHA